MVGDVPNSLKACVTHDEAVKCLQKEAAKGECKEFKEAKLALSSSKSVYGFPPEVLASVFVTLVGEADDLALRLECSDGLETAATEAPRIMGDFLWDLEDLLMEVDDPALFQNIANAAVNATIADSPDAARSVADTLTGVLEAEESHDYSKEGEIKRRAAIKGLRALAECSNTTIQGHVARTIVDYLDEGIVG